MKITRKFGKKLFTARIITYNRIRKLTNDIKNLPPENKQMGKSKEKRVVIVMLIE